MEQTTEQNAESVDLSVLGGFFRGLKPVKRLTVSDWADQNRFLSDKAAAEAGRWRTSRTPYLRDIMDSLSSSSTYQRIVVMKGAQLGLTEAGLNWIGYVIDNDPSSMLLVMPTEGTLKRNVKTRIDPMIKDTPVLAERFPSSAKKGEDTLTEKIFEGGVLFMAGANAPAGLRSVPIARVFLDEVDAYPANLDDEGSPVKLAEARTRTFARRKIFMISTPKIQDSSIIEAEYKETDQRHFFVPCPHCGAFQSLHWEQVRWDMDTSKPKKAWYECEHCGDAIQETSKTAMLAHGEWRATVPEKSSTTTVGFYINSLYSPYGWYSWLDAAKEYVEASKDEAKLITFTNTVLGLPYAVKAETIAWEVLLNRRETYKLNQPPKGVSFLTAGVDIQRDRIEIEIVGWGRGKRSWSIDYRVLVGDTANDAVWEKLAAIVNETWTRVDGVVMPLTMMAIDTGYNASKIYTFVRRFDPTRVKAIKGVPNPYMMLSVPSRVDVSNEGEKVGQIELWSVGVGYYKSEIYAALRLHKDELGESPIGYCHFPLHGVYGETYFRGLTAEQLQEVRDNKGYTKHQWVKIYKRNEPLDCRVYARAAASIIGIDRFQDEQYEAIERIYGVEKKSQPIKKRSDFWD